MGVGESPRVKGGEAGKGNHHSTESHTKMSGARRGEKYCDKGWLRQKYWEEGLTIQDLARLARVSHTTIRGWMIGLGIPRRTCGEAQRGRKHSLERRQKESKARRGKNNPFWGKKHSLETLGKLRGKKHHNWKGGRRQHPEGYVFILRPNHPYVCKQGYVLEHRLIMENDLGRFLTPEEIVHHINGIPNDNRIENLMLFASQSEHAAFHNAKRKVLEK